MNPAELHSIKRKRLFRQTEPPQPPALSVARGEETPYILRMTYLRPDTKYGPTAALLSKADAEVIKYTFIVLLVGAGLVVGVTGEPLLALFVVAVCVVGAGLAMLRNKLLKRK